MVDVQPDIPPWAWALIIPTGIALVGAIWKLYGRQADKDSARIEKRLDDHIVDDVKMHERLVRVETKQEIHDREINDLRAKTTGIKHDILGEVTKQIMSWYNDILKIVQSKPPRER